MSPNTSNPDGVGTALVHLITRLRHDWRILFEKRWDYHEGLDALAVNGLAAELGRGTVFELESAEDCDRLKVRHPDPHKPPIVWTVSIRGYSQLAEIAHDKDAAANGRAKFADTIAYLRSWEELTRQRGQSSSPSSDRPQPTHRKPLVVSDTEFFERWADTLDQLAVRLTEMTFTPDALSIEERDLERIGAQAGRALLEIVIRFGGGLPQPTMTGTLEPAPTSIHIRMKPDDPDLYQRWVERIPPQFLSIVCSWGSNFRGLTPQERDAALLRQFWSMGGMVIFATYHPERFSCVNPGTRDFPVRRPTGQDHNGQTIWTTETEHMTLAERAAWRRSQARDWADACRAIASVVRKLVKEKAVEHEAEPRGGAPNQPLLGAHSTSSNEPIANPLEAIRADLQRLQSDEVEQNDRRARHEQMAERLGERFRNVTSFGRGLFAPAQYPRNETFFLDLARGVLALNEVLREFDREYPRFRILERLRRASQTGVVALDIAASLLLQEPDSDPTTLAVDLARFQESRPHDVWAMWLTYILDQLVNSHWPPAEKINAPPDTTREEWRIAELAFGCILFPDETFRVLQEGVDYGASEVEDALKCGGYPPLRRPPCRVRNLITYFDSRALHWYASNPPEPLGLLEPPPAIAAITEPPSLRRQLDEVWTAANVLQIVLDNWAKWFVELREKEDAHPGVALHYRENAQRAIAVLISHCPNVAPFNTTDEAALRAMLPPIPAWWMPGPDVNVGPDNKLMETIRTRWQDDREFLDRYYAKPERRIERAKELRGAAALLIDRLKSFPMSVLAAPSSPVTRKNQSVSISERQQPVPTVGIITALPLETSAVRAILGEPEQFDVPGTGAGRTYWKAEIPSPRGGVHHIVLAQGDMGNNPAAIRATQLHAHFPGVKTIIMCGIAGGVPNPNTATDHVRLGDIVVSSQKGIVQYDFVKRTVQKKSKVAAQEVRATSHRPSAMLIDVARRLESDMHFGKYPWEAWIQKGLERLGWTRPGDASDLLADSANPAIILTHPLDSQRRLGQPRVFSAPIASANTLLKDPLQRDALRKQFGVKAVEMEGSGIQDATWSHEVGYLVVRGICDYCDSNKNDVWQPYAAIVAAAYVRAILEAMPGTE